MQVEQEDNVETQVATRNSPERSPEQPSNPKKGWLIAVLAFVVVAIVVISGIVPRVRARSTLRNETNQLAVPAVIVAQPKKSAPGQEVILPANIQAFRDAPIYARTNGYLKRWYVDIGARVKSGQLLAEIDTPEVDQQLRSGASGLGHRRSEHASLGDYGIALSGSVEKRFRVAAGCGQRQRRFRGEEGDRAVGAGELAAARRIAVVRENLCALRWGHHGAQYRYRPVD